MPSSAEAPAAGSDSRSASPQRQRGRGLGGFGSTRRIRPQLGRGGPITIDWQTDGKHYQYWARADAAGRFTIPNARPGAYTLYAFTDGVLGEFSRADVRVEAGKTTELGEMGGPRCAMAGNSGRSASPIAAPRNSATATITGSGGCTTSIPRSFPTTWISSSARATVGMTGITSSLRAPTARAAGRTPPGGSASTWTRRPTGTATLRLAICGARGGPVDAAVNGHSIGGTGELPESGVMHRDGIRSDALTERNLKFDAALLKPGENIIELTKHVRAWTDGVLYDYLRLELEEKGK